MLRIATNEEDILERLGKGETKCIVEYCVLQQYIFENDETFQLGAIYLPDSFLGSPVCWKPKVLDVIENEDNIDQKISTEMPTREHR